ncbi:polyhydroxyalkanoic acid synthase subunit PhaR [Neobacillus sp. KR4-4]|uniref:polyhydroxyalkanoic acid synthase subunit PhaR n=1 Tax=Neobacillus sp. KR4-4 TaxID=3344872 RepID=UPI0035CC0E8C
MNQDFNFYDMWKDFYSQSSKLFDGKLGTEDFNVYDMWKDIYSQSSKLFDEKFGNDYPSQGMGQLLEMNLQFKKMIDESTLKYLEFMNVPSRNDIANISSLIVNVDAKVDDLEEKLEQKLENNEGQLSFKSELSNVKKDVKNLDNKLNQILTLLNTQKEKK